MIFALEILDAVEQGIVVVFSAGNGQFAIEPQVPGVIAAGGVFADQSGRLRASNYASGYASPWIPGVRVPTVCGLVGLLPRAQYLMLPVPPGCAIDVDESQPDPVDPKGDPGDTTTEEDGWAIFSGTSAAAPQIAGAVAVLLGARPGLTPAQVTEALARTATDVTTGTNHPRFGHSADAGPDLATGPGLVNVSAALDFVLTQPVGAAGGETGPRRDASAVGGGGRGRGGSEGSRGGHGQGEAGGAGASRERIEDLHGAEVGRPADCLDGHSLFRDLFRPPQRAVILGRWNAGNGR